MHVYLLEWHLTCSFLYVCVDVAPCGWSYMDRHMLELLNKHVLLLYMNGLIVSILALVKCTVN